MKKRSEATQTLRTGCSKADSQTNTDRQGRLQHTAQLSAQCKNGPSEQHRTYSKET